MINNEDILSLCTAKEKISWSLQSSMKPQEQEKLCRGKKPGADPASVGPSHLLWSVEEWWGEKELQKWRDTEVNNALYVHTPESEHVLLLKWQCLLQKCLIYGKPQEISSSSPLMFVNCWPKSFHCCNHQSFFLILKVEFFLAIFELTVFSLCFAFACFSPHALAPLCWRKFIFHTTSDFKIK